MTLTELQAERVVGAFAAGADWALAARILGIPRSTLRRAIEADAGLMERVDDARAQADEVVIKCLYTKATVDKDTTAMIFWLKNRRPREWRDRRELEMAVPDTYSVVREAAELVRARRREFQETMRREPITTKAVGGEGSTLVPLVSGGNGENDHE
jgi:hypothetical protein